VHPQAEKESIFRTFFAVSGRFEEDLELELVVLDRILQATTKKVVNFFREKVQPRQNPGYAYGATVSTSEGHDRCWGRNAKFCVTVDPESGLLSYWLIPGNRSARIKLKRREWSITMSTLRRLSIYDTKWSVT